jgi:hypothetical protein
MPQWCACARSVLAALALQFLFVPSTALAQQARVSVRVAPFGAASVTPLFKVDIVESKSRTGIALPSMTLTNSPTGPQISNLALALPELTIGGTTVASRFGDQSLPQTFLNSPLSGTAVQQPIRGASFSTRGATPWTLSVGRLDAGADTEAWSSDSPGVVALALSLSPYERVSLAPRLLVPVGGGDAGQAVMGTAIQAKLSPHVSLRSDVGAADTDGAAWAPLASAGVIGHWARTELETSVLRGAPSHAVEGVATVGSVDRELARGRVQPISGLAISGLASWSRPASVTDAADTTVGSVGIVYDRLPYGQLAATRQREFTASHAVDTTRLEWRRRAARGFTVRFTETRASHDDPSVDDLATTLVEVDLPSLTPHRPDSRLDLRATVTAAPSAAIPNVSSKVSGRFHMFDAVALGGETELALARGDQEQIVRTLRLTTDVAVMRDTAVHFLYTYGAGTPFSFTRAFEARVSRTINLFPK